MVASFGGAARHEEGWALEASWAERGSRLAEAGPTWSRGTRRARGPAPGFGSSRRAPGGSGLQRRLGASATRGARDRASRPAPPSSRESAASRLAVRGRGRRGGRSERRRRRRRADWAVEVRVASQVDARGPAGLGRGPGGLGAVGRGGAEARGRSLRWRLGAAPSGPRPRAGPRAPRRPAPCCPPEPGPGPSPSSPPHPRAPAPRLPRRPAAAGRGRRPRGSRGAAAEEWGAAFRRLSRGSRGCHSPECRASGVTCTVLTSPPPPPRSPVARRVVVAAPCHPAPARRAGPASLPGASWEKARPVATSAAGAAVPLAARVVGLVTPCNLLRFPYSSCCRGREGQSSGSALWTPSPGLC